ncbi:UNVERIFIED_CONTAM: hypothetical protein FKN15_005004 [Acipenser sinensis]
MVENRNDEALHNQDKLLTLFLENLEHSDSFVYLSAIQGLTMFSDVFPEQILLRMLKEFEESPKEMKKLCSIETRLKTGEALMRATSGLTGKRRSKEPGASPTNRCTTLTSQHQHTPTD